MKIKLILKIDFTEKYSNKQQQQDKMEFANVNYAKQANKNETKQERLKKETEEKAKKETEKKEREKKETEKYKKRGQEAELQQKRLKKLADLKAAIAYGIDCEKWHKGCFRGHLFNDWKQSEFDTLKDAIEEAIHLVGQGEIITGIVKRHKKFGEKWALRTGTRFYEWDPACHDPLRKSRTFDLCSGWLPFKKDE